MHFVYLFGPGPEAELRHSLRSISTHFKVDSVTVIGHKPEWAVDVNHVPTENDAPTRYGRTRHNLHQALPDLPARFVLMNDDFFVMRKTTIPNWHLGRFLEFHPPRPGLVHFKRSLSDTAWLLREWGYRRPLNYETHAPMKVVRDDMATVLDSVADWDVGTLQMRSLYGNVADVGGTQQPDCLYSKNDVWLDDDPPWVSTTDRWWAEGNIGRQIRAMYPDPSPFEKLT